MLSSLAIFEEELHCWCLTGQSISLCLITYYSTKKVWGEASHHWRCTRESWNSPASQFSWFTLKQQDEILHWSRVLIPLSNIRHENHKVLKQPWRHFTSLNLYQCSQIPQPSPRVTSTSNRIKTTTNCLIIYIRLHNALDYTASLAEWLRESSRTPGETQGNLALTSLSHFLDLTPERKEWKLRSVQRSYFVQLHKESREKLIPSNTR